MAKGKEKGVTPLWDLLVENYNKARNHYVTGALGEFFGTMILCFFAVGGGLQSFFKAQSIGIPINDIGPNIAGSLGLMIAIIIYGGASGGHVNPAVTLGMAIAGRCSWIKVPIYWFVQFLGGYIGSGLAYGIYQYQVERYEKREKRLIDFNVFSPVPKDIPIGTGLLDQIMSTIILMMVIMACTDSRNMKVSKGMCALYISLTVFALSFGFGLNAGGVVNSARDLAPRLMAITVGYNSSDIMQNSMDGEPQEWWLVGFFGPILGGAIGSLIYIFSVGMHLEDEDGSPAPRRSMSKRYKDTDRQEYDEGMGNNGGGGSDWRSSTYIPKAAVLGANSEYGGNKGYNDQGPVQGRFERGNSFNNPGGRYDGGGGVSNPGYKRGAREYNA